MGARDVSKACQGLADAFHDGRASSMRDCAPDAGHIHFVCSAMPDVMWQ